MIDTVDRPKPMRRLLNRTVPALLTTATIAGAGFAVMSGSAFLNARAEGTDLAVAAEPTPVTVRALRLEPGFSSTRSFLGQVEPAQTADLSFELAGKLTEIAVEEGDSVQRGDVLARQDTGLLEAELTRLQASRAALEAELAFADAALARRAALKERGFSPAESFDQAQATRNALAARIRETDAAMDATRLRIAKSTLHAPFDGRIGARVQDTGATVAAGQPVLRVLQDGTAVIRVGLPVWTDVAESADLTVAIAGTEVAARVIGTRPDIDPATRTRTVLLEAALPSGASFGQTVTMTLPRQVEETGAWVPVQALREGAQGVWTVYTVDAASRVRPAAVEILHMDAERAYVRGSFQDGDQLIAVGPHRVTPGQIVHVAKES